MDSKYRTMLAKYNASTSAELEVRLTINKDIFITILTSFINSGKTLSISQTIDLINNNSDKFSKNITSIVFANGVQGAKTYMRKTSLERPINVDNTFKSYRISLADETSIDKYDINRPDIIRIKLRVSAIIDNWRIDMTLVKELHDMNQLKANKDKMLFKIDIPTFIDNAPFDVADRIELEMEHIKPKLPTKVSATSVSASTSTVSEADIDDIVNTMLIIMDIKTATTETTYQDEIYNLAKHIIHKKDLYRYKDKFGMKQLAVQSKPLTRINIASVKSNLLHYFITDKADGQRALAYRDGMELTILSSIVEKRTLKVKSIGLTIIDTEMIDGEMFIFDVLYFEGLNLMEKPLSERLNYFIDASTVMQCKHKTMFQFGVSPASDINKLLAYVKKLKYHTDGYILTSNDAYKYMTVYKLKNLKDITIDFLVKQCPKSLLGIHPYDVVENKTLFLLFSGINKYSFEKYRLLKLPKYDEIFDKSTLNTNYFPIQFSPSSAPLAYLYYVDTAQPNKADNTAKLDKPTKPDKSDKTDKTAKSDKPTAESIADHIANQICELFWNGTAWELYRMRDDRAVEVNRGTYYGNDFNVAESIWQSYENPVHLEDLYNTLSNDYFQESDNQLYKASRNFNSYVKSTLIEKHKTHTAIDLASGKGQDINRYTNSGFNHVLFIDSDKSALQELVSRKQTIKSSMKISVLHTNLLDSVDITIAKINALMTKSVPLIVLNFAIHYLVDNVNAIDNLITLIDSLLSSGGTFIFTCFDGSKIHKLLNTGDWNAYDDEVLKYSIKKKYQSDSLEIGQKIDIILPFTRGEYYEETLVDINYIINAFNAIGASKYKTEICPFGKYISGYKNKSDLSDDDVKFVSLYSAVVLHKSNKASKASADATTKKEISNEAYIDTTNKLIADDNTDDIDDNILEDTSNTV